jgi:murein DD-endopeptidase MepM/ murein hydrolase activator NlpD
VRRKPSLDWRRRILRTPTSPSRCLVRGGRILLLLLSVTGCAVEPPRPTLDPAPRLVALVPPPVVSGFGAARGEGGGATSSRHAGIDIRATTGTPVLAAADGIVLRTGSQVVAGRLIVIEHAVALTSVYYHLSAVTVAPGQTVRRGDVIGRAGMSGNATAPHLHFGVCRREGGLCNERIDDGWRDPVRLWIATNPCYIPGWSYPAQESRLTYPVPCQSPPAAADRPADRVSGA